jgi:hypothetical protein
MFAGQRATTAVAQNDPVDRVPLLNRHERARCRVGTPANGYRGMNHNNYHTHHVRHPVA